MGTRMKVFRVFKALHKTRMNVFKDDSRALTAARQKINEEFRKNKGETSEEKINQMIKMASDVEVVLRQSVIQGVHVGDKKIVLRPRRTYYWRMCPIVTIRGRRPDYKDICQ